MSARKSFSIESINALKVKLRERAKVAKPVVAKPLDAAQTVKVISSEIKLLQKQGYTLMDIAGMLKEYDVPIGVPTLKSALTRSRAGKKIIVVPPAAEA
jgi:hypothetical protein